MKLFGRLLLILWVLTACSERTAAPSTPLESELPQRLSAWGMLVRQAGALLPARDVRAYDLNTPLFSDYAHKLRTLWVPPTARAQPLRINQRGLLELPVGSVLTKTFYFPRSGVGAEISATPVTRAEFSGSGLNLEQVRLIETRVLVHRESGWRGAAYVWNVEQTEATLRQEGDLLPLRVNGLPQFEYLIPDRNQCGDCHARNHDSRQWEPLGITLSNLDRRYRAPLDNSAQVEAKHALGLTLSQHTGRAPLARWDDETVSLPRRARAYLDVNCGHCHNREGAADTSGLYLDLSTAEASISLGICKSPVAAGRGSGTLRSDIVPGDSSRSILVYRLRSLDPGVLMPELGRATVHREGLALIRRWIDAMPGRCADASAKTLQTGAR